MRLLLDAQTCSSSYGRAVLLLTCLLEVVMKIAVTGTPGTGKTSACRAFVRTYGDTLRLKLVELNRVVEEQRLYEGFDEERGCYIADLNKLRNFVEAMNEDVLLESHLAHLVAPDYVIVLRADPLVLVERLRNEGFPERKIRENAEAEALDVILVEALEACGDDRVFEVDTSRKSVEEVAACIREIVEAVKSGKLDEVRKKYKPGRLDWSHRLEALNKSDLRH